MRTALFFGLLCIADAIGQQTGGHLAGAAENMAVVILTCSIAADIIEFFKELK